MGSTEYVVCNIEKLVSHLAILKPALVCEKQLHFLNTVRFNHTVFDFSLSILESIPIFYGFGIVCRLIDLELLNT